MRSKRCEIRRHHLHVEIHRDADQRASIPHTQPPLLPRHSSKAVTAFTSHSRWPRQRSADHRRAQHRPGERGRALRPGSRKRLCAPMEWASATGFSPGPSMGVTIQFQERFPDPHHTRGNRRRSFCDDRSGTRDEPPWPRQSNTRHRKPRPRNSSITSKYFSMNSVWPFSSTRNAFPRHAGVRIEAGGAQIHHHRLDESGSKNGNGGDHGCFLKFALSWWETAGKKQRPATRGWEAICGTISSPGFRVGILALMAGLPARARVAKQNCPRVRILTCGRAMRQLCARQADFA